MTLFQIYLTICFAVKPFEYYISRRLFRGYWINEHPEIHRNKKVSDKGLPIIATLMSFPIPFLGVLVSFIETGFSCWRREKNEVIQLSFLHSHYRPADLLIFPKELNKQNRGKYSEFSAADTFHIQHTPRITKALKGDFLPTKRV